MQNDFNLINLQQWCTRRTLPFRERLDFYCYRKESTGQHYSGTSSGPSTRELFSGCMTSTGVLLRLTDPEHRGFVFLRQTRFLFLPPYSYAPVTRAREREIDLETLLN